MKTLPTSTSLNILGLLWCATTRWMKRFIQGCPMLQSHLADWRPKCGTIRICHLRPSVQCTEPLSCLSSLLYGAETWPVYRIVSYKFNTYMMRHLRQILNVKWWDFISNKEILAQANLPSMYELLSQKNLRWAGHVHRMDNTRLPKQILYSQLKEGTRGIGRPRLRFKDTFKRSLKDLKIPFGSWQSLSKDRCKWRSTIYRKSSSDTKDS